MTPKQRKMIMEKIKLSTDQTNQNYQQSSEEINALLQDVSNEDNVTNIQNLFDMIGDVDGQMQEIEDSLDMIDDSSREETIAKQTILKGMKALKESHSIYNAILTITAKSIGDNEISNVLKDNALSLLSEDVDLPEDENLLNEVIENVLGGMPIDEAITKIVGEGTAKQTNPQNREELPPIDIQDTGRIAVRPAQELAQEIYNPK